MTNDVFIKKEDFQSIIDKNTYFDRLNRVDLTVRGVDVGDYNEVTEAEALVSAKDITSLRESYRSRYKDSYMDLSKQQKEEILHLIQFIDFYHSNRFSWSSSFVDSNPYGLGMKYSVLGNIPWKIACFHEVTDGWNKPIEGGFCHTLDHCIMIPTVFFSQSVDRKISLLIHEKMHVLQRLYPEWSENVIKEWGFFRNGTEGDGVLDETIEEIRRHNPDLDLFDYGYNKFDGRIIELYHGDNSLLDSSTMLIQYNGEKTILNNDMIDMPSYISQIEHPYEMMASMVPILIMKSNHYKRDHKESILFDALFDHVMESRTK